MSTGGRVGFSAQTPYGAPGFLVSVRRVSYAYSNSGFKAIVRVDRPLERRT
jgi:hypothetical protein